MNSQQNLPLHLCYVNVVLLRDANGKICKNPMQLFETKTDFKVEKENKRRKENGVDDGAERKMEKKTLLICVTVHIYLSCKNL